MTHKSQSGSRMLRYFRRSETAPRDWRKITAEKSDWEKIYRNRWQYDKVVRSTHGVNCTGSCSWQVFVKNGIITWEMQATDYPSNGPDFPDFEPRGCPRGASFSWYEYSPLRLKYPYVRSALLQLWRRALERTKDPAKAWQEIASDSSESSRYKMARGKGGFVRASWDEVNQLISASLVSTIKKYGPDRIFGFSPIPAMSMVSYAAGTRFLSLIGGVCSSFYDWYADLPIASPQIWGEQTDVPESADWYNSGYIVMWGSNIPMTRTPDAHFMTEARYHGAKVVAVSPDYAEYTKFADMWLAPLPGTDGAMALSMMHVILKEFYVEKETPYFKEYAKENTDLPFLVILENNNGNFIASRFLRAEDIGQNGENSKWKTALYDLTSGRCVIPNGSLGFRWSSESVHWNLRMVDSSSGQKIDPALTMLGNQDEIVPVAFPYFDGNSCKIKYRSIPVKKIVGANGGNLILVTTVFDLLLGNLGVRRPLLEAGNYAETYDDLQEYTPHWQEKITGVDRKVVAQIAREFARNAEVTKGKSMIILGAGINHWYHSDQIYRAILSLLMLTGSEGVNGGGWAHYVGQEKVRPVEGFAAIAFALDWARPPRRQNTTSFVYFATDQWRYEDILPSSLGSPLVGETRYKHPADYNALAVRLGWLPFYPQFDRNSISIIEDAKRNGFLTDQDAIKFTVNQLKERKIHFSIEDPDAPENFPRILFVWRANFLFSSGKGSEYYLKHLLGTKSSVMASESQVQPTEFPKREAPEGKLDLLVTLDFRMSSTALYSDIILPAATWYEKYDLSSTDMHPLVHPFTPAINPPWEAKSDWDIFLGIAKSFSQLAKDSGLGLAKDIVCVPLLHDSPDELAQPFGEVKDWRTGEVDAIPGKTMPRLVVVERDFPNVYERMMSLGLQIAEKPFGAKGLAWSEKEEYEELKRTLGTRRSPYSQDLPDISEPKSVAEAILTLSGATNSDVALKSWKALEAKTSCELASIAREHAGVKYSFGQLVTGPKRVLDTPLETGIAEGNRTYSAFTLNLEKRVPWRTLTGRQQFYLDHDVIKEFGENLPTYLPPPKVNAFEEGDAIPDESSNDKRLVLRFMTPHGKWQIHSTYMDNQHMLTLFRGGPVVWLNHEDAKSCDIADNDWIEVYNRNGVITARAVTSHRLPRGFAIMYHAQERTINVKDSTISEEPGGSHNAVTRVHIKPTQMIGGYAQLSYEFNYYGPIGSQRDTMVVVRKLLREGE